MLTLPFRLQRILYLLLLTSSISTLADELHRSPYGYELNLPAGWRIATDTERSNLIEGSPKPEIAIDAIALTTRDDNGFTPKIIIMVLPQRLYLDQMSLQSYERVIRSKYSNDDSKLLEISGSINKIGQTQCLDFYTAYEEKLKRLATRTFLIPYNRQTFIVLCSTSQTNAHIHGPQFETMIKSFRIQPDEPQNHTTVPHAATEIGKLNKVVTREGFEFELIDDWTEYTQEEYATFRDLLAESGVDGHTAYEAIVYDSDARGIDRVYARIDAGHIAQPMSLTEDDRVGLQSGLVQSYTDAGKSVVVLSSEIATVGRHRCIRVVIESPLAEYTVVKETYVYPVKDKTYRFTCSCLASKYPEYKPQFNAIMSTLSISDYPAVQHQTQSEQFESVESLSPVISASLIVTISAVVVLAIAITSVYLLKRRVP